LKFLFIIAMVAMPFSKGTSIKSFKRDCESVDAPRFPNIGYILSGYDIYHGNPIPTDGIVDPGFRSPIFSAEYNGDTTPDYRYCTPDGLSILSCADSCSISFNTDVIYGTYSYYSKLSGSVGIGVSAGGGSFGASIGWGHIQSYTESGLNIFTQSEAQCCAYTADMYDFIMPPFHKNFIAGLGTLTEEYNPSVYRRFIKAFGTHFISKSTMGALYGEQSMISSESWSEMVQNNFDIGLYASFSVIDSINASLNYNNSVAETFKRYTKEQLIYSRGAAPPSDGKPLTWAQSTIEEPNVLAITLEPLDTLPIEEFVTPVVLKNLRLALDEYCPQLLEEGELSSCDIPPPDPPAPKPRVWSHWSNFREGDDYPIQECGEGQYVEKMKWSYQGHTYGLVDFKMKCSGEFFWRSPAIGNPNGDWDHEMNCKESGFRLAAGREDDWPGIVNVRAICLGSQTEITSNNDMRGKYNRDLACRSEGQQIVGMQVRKETHHGITNFRVLCA